MIAAFVIALFKEHLFIAFDEEIARAYGHRVDLLDAALLVCLALTVIIGVRLVGVLLVEAMLVVPAATAALWATTFRRQVAFSCSLGAASGVIGLFASYRFNLAAGGTIVLVSVVAFLRLARARATLERPAAALGAGRSLQRTARVRLRSRLRARLASGPL